MYGRTKSNAFLSVSIQTQLIIIQGNQKILSVAGAEAALITTYWVDECVKQQHCFILLFFVLFHFAVYLFFFFSLAMNIKASFMPYTAFASGQEA